METRTGILLGLGVAIAGAAGATAFVKAPPREVVTEVTALRPSGPPASAPSSAGGNAAGGVLAAAPGCSDPPPGGRQPVAIFHAFDQRFAEIEGYVCDLAGQGYSHVQIPPVQKSNFAGGQWYGRYQPIDYTRVEGRGTESELRSLTSKAHCCGMRVIADVVFNQMANLPPFYEPSTGKLDFPGLSQEDFHRRCDINYADGNQTSEIECWLNGDLPDLDQGRPQVESIQKEHLSALLRLGVDGFRFDAAKHMSRDALQKYVGHIDDESHRNTWSYLEVIEDGDTRGESYGDIAAITDFRLYRTVRDAFSFGGDLKSLRVPRGLDDARSVVFGINHDTDQNIHDHPLDAYANRSDSLLATAYVLAREQGTPLVLNTDNHDVPYIPTGVKFRQIMQQREDQGSSVAENVLGVVDSPTLLVMQRGAEGLFVVNKAAEVFDVPVLDLTLTELEGCYRELRNGFHVSIERRGTQKFVTRWGSPSRGGMQVHARDALYFVRDPQNACD